jgi:hypothetical protein
MNKRSLAGIALLAIMPGRVLAQADKLETESATVVKLRIYRANKTEATAAGLFVGKDQQNAYFITACHAVFPECNVGNENEGVAVDSVGLQFHASPQEFKSTVFGRYDPDLDLAVVQTAVANLPPQLPTIVRRDVALGLQVHIIGHPAEGEWVPSYGRVRNVNTPSGQIHHFITAPEELFSAGDSGGPVLDSDGGFLGMHTAAVDAGYGKEAKSAEIVNQLKAWRVPPSNLQEPTTPPPVGPSQVEVEINRVLDSYEDAHNRKDVDALWRVWPNPPAKTRQGYLEYFKNARSITMRMTGRRIEIGLNGASATVTAQSFQDFVPKIGTGPPPLKGPIALKLVKQNGAWIIASVD